MNIFPFSIQQRAMKNSFGLPLIAVILMFGLVSCGDADEAEESTDPKIEISDESIIEDNSKAGIKNFIGQDIYKKWTAKKAQYTSPTHGTVVVYFNDILAKSFEDENTTHPINSAAVKEILNSSGEVIGHAAGVKITTDSDANSWVWYELLASGTDIYGIGHASCVGCHKKKEISDYMDSKPD